MKQPTVHLNKILKYEFLNILRNRWIFMYSIFVALTLFSIQKITGEYEKTFLTFSTLAVVFIPLISSLFTSLYWYYNDRFTLLLMTQPLKRNLIFFSRFIAITTSLSICFGLGILLGAILSNNYSLDLLLLFGVGTLLNFIFVALSMMISASFEDRMRGIGIVFAIWLYFVFAHDGIVLLTLISLREYPMEITGGIIGSANPIGLARVVLLMYNNGSLLLGHTGALVREILTSWIGYFWAIGVSFTWAVVPLLLGGRLFSKRDF